MKEFSEKDLFGCPHALGHATAVLCTDQQAGNPRKNTNKAIQKLRCTISGHSWLALPYWSIACLGAHVQLWTSQIILYTVWHVHYIVAPQVPWFGDKVKKTICSVDFDTGLLFRERPTMHKSHGFVSRINALEKSLQFEEDLESLGSFCARDLRAVSAHVGRFLYESEKF